MLGLVAGGTAMLLAACGLSDRASYRFRMTIEAETPTGTRSGSGVLRVNAMKSPALTAHEHAGGAGVSGEAVALDLPTGPVFALLTTGDGKPLLATRVTLALAPEADALDAGKFVKAVDRLGGWFGHAKADLPREYWPMMVRFRDLNDPASVEKVDPDVIGVKRIVLETTGDDMTTGLEKWLPWLSRIRGGYLHGGSTSRDAPLGLNGGDFKRR